MKFINQLGGLKDQLKTLQRLVYRNLYSVAAKGKNDREAIDRFHELYYDSALLGLTWSATRWLGVPVLKCPLDLWLYQEIFFELKPDWIVETGTAAGGSALYIASLLDLLKKGNVISIDIEARHDRPAHPRITYLTGSSTSPDIFAKVKEMLKGSGTVLVILDSDHSAHHVAQELDLYKSLVTSGSYVIVEDSNINGHPVAPKNGPGPMEAILHFLQTNKDFTIDKSKEKFLMSFNPKGYLKRL